MLTGCNRVGMGSTTSSGASRDLDLELQRDPRRSRRSTGCCRTGVRGWPASRFRTGLRTSSTGWWSAALTLRSPGIDGSFCRSVRRAGAALRGLRFADFQESNIGPGWHEDALQALLREVPRKGPSGVAVGPGALGPVHAVVRGERHGRPPLLDVSRRGVAAPPAVVWTAGARALREAIASVYTRLDQAHGRLLDAAEPEVVCLCSDHGLGGGARALPEPLSRAAAGCGTSGGARRRAAVGVGLLDRAQALA